MVSPKLIAYVGKRVPELVRNYSVTELEKCSLVINIASFVHLLKRVDLDAIVDHLALTYIIKSKAEPTTTRIKRFLEVLSSYSFNLYYIKGKDMILSDFVSRQKHDDCNLHEIIPISFNMQNILQTKHYNIGRKEQPEVHGINKGIDPNIRMEKQVIDPIISPNTKSISQVRPRLGQGRAGTK